MPRVTATHPHWTDDLLLSDESDAVHHSNGERAGRYERDGTTLRVFWDRYPAETFIDIGGVYAQNTLIEGAPSLEDLRILQAHGMPVKPTRVSVMIPGICYEVSLRLDDSDVAAFRQVFSVREYDAASLPDHADYIVDLGANIGLASVFFGTRYPQARLVAVEPDGGNFALLQANIRALGTRAAAVRAAIWKENGEINLKTREPDGARLHSWGIQVTEEHSESSESVRAVQLDSLMAESALPMIDILKVDIEGAELELFTSKPQRWLPRVRYLLIETHDRFRPGSNAAVTHALATDFDELDPIGESRIFRRKT